MDTITRVGLKFSAALVHIDAVPTGWVSNFLQRRSADAVLSIMNLCPWTATVRLRCNHYILGYTDAVTWWKVSLANFRYSFYVAHLWSSYSVGAYAVTKLVQQWSVFWPYQLGWHKNVLKTLKMFMPLSWWRLLGPGKWHLPARQFIIMYRLIPLSTPLFISQYL